MGLRRSLTRDSAMSTDSLYSSFASSIKRKWVDLLTLQEERARGEKRKFVSEELLMFYNLHIFKNGVRLEILQSSLEARNSSDLQHWVSGTRMDSSSWECFPKLHRIKKKERKHSIHLCG